MDHADTRTHANPSETDKTNEDPENRNTVAAHADIATWVLAIPENNRPTTLLERFPHILWRLRDQWDSPEALVKVFNDIGIDMRGDRRGLPSVAMKELYQLWDYYFVDLHPESTSALEPKQGINPYLIRR